MGTKTPVVRIEKRDLTDRLWILNVPMDILEPSKIDSLLENLLLAKGAHQVVFLRVPDFMRALRNPGFRSCLEEASLVIPVSRSLQKAARRIANLELFRYAPFDFVVRILNVLDQKSGTFYLLGDTSNGLAIVEKNLRSTFPHSQALGRFVGKFYRPMERNIMTAITKASPNLLLLGPGPRGRDLWIQRRKQIFPRGVQVWCSECFDYFGLRCKRPNRVAFRKGRDFFHEISLKPGKIFLFPIYLLFKFTILFARLRK